uniref:Uncharacterized protein n=1 Tax=Anopheles merus TaxID=30066 RepID=A0A182V740_ANOME
MDLATILLLLETPPPKGGYHNFLIEHLAAGSGGGGPGTTSSAGASPAHKRLSPSPPGPPGTLAASSARSTPIAGRKLGHHQHLLVRAKNYYCSNPMLNNSTNLYCNLDMESLEEMLKKYFLQQLLLQLPSSKRAQDGFPAFYCRSEIPA